MSNKLTLDQIRETANKKYANTDIEVDADTTCRLLNVLQLPKEQRDKVGNLQDQLGSEDDANDVDQAEVFRGIFRIVAESAEDVEKLIDAVGDNVAMLVTIFDEYTSETEVGEA